MASHFALLSFCSFVAMLTPLKQLTRPFFLVSRNLHYVARKHHSRHALSFTSAIVLPPCLEAKVVLVGKFPNFPWSLAFS